MSTAEDVAKTITLTGTDADGDSLTFKVSTLPASGQLYDGTGTGGHHVVAGDLPYTVTDGAGKVTFDPTADFNGSDNFAFLANDGTVNSAGAATVNVTVTGSTTRPMRSTTRPPSPRTARSRPASWATTAGPGQRVRPDADHHGRRPAPSTARSPSPARPRPTPRPPTTTAPTASPTPHRRRHDQRRPDPQDHTATVSITVTEVNDAPTAHQRLGDRRRGRLGHPHRRPGQRPQGPGQRVRPDPDRHRRDPGPSTARSPSTARHDLHPDRRLQRPRQLHLHDPRQRHDQRHRRSQTTRPRSASPSPRSTTRPRGRRHGHRRRGRTGTTSVLGNDIKGPANESGQTLTVTVRTAIGGTVTTDGTTTIFTPAADYNGPASYHLHIPRRRHHQRHCRSDDRARPPSTLRSPRSTTRRPPTTTRRRPTRTTRSTSTS